MIVMILLATLVVFIIASLVPADPILAQLGDMQAADEALVAAYRAKWGLDLPLWEQYWIFLTKLVHGDFGISISSQRPVLADIAQYAPATIELSTIAFVLAVLIGVPLGVLAAVRRDSWIDHVARMLSLVGVSAPTFWLAFIMLALFYGGLRIAPGPGRLDVIYPAAAHGHRALSDRQRARRPMGRVPERRCPPGAALDRAGGDHARPDHPHHARGDAGGAPPGLRPRRARQGHGRVGDRAPPRAAQRADPGGHARRPRLCRAAQRHGADRDHLLLAGPRPLHLPQRRRRSTSRRSWASPSSSPWSIW